MHDNGSGWVLDNARVRAVIDRRGLLVSLVGPTGHDLIPADGVGNLLRLHRDLPANWDAWDIAADIESGAIDLLDVTSIEPITGEDRVDMVFMVLNKNQTVVVFTNTGMKGSVVWFALEMMGYDARLYSYQDWMANQQPDLREVDGSGGLNETAI